MEAPVVEVPVAVAHEEADELTDDASFIKLTAKHSKMMSFLDKLNNH